MSGSFIPYAKQTIEDDDIAAITQVLRSDFLTQGPAVGRFEQDFASLSGAPDAVAVSSATAALHLTCLALEVGPGDLVWTPSNSFVASANCALYCGATVDFLEIDPLTLNLSIPHFEKKLAEAKRAGKLPKVVIPVHFSGLSCDMRSLSALCRPLGIKLLEDASHAVGASYLGRPVGSCAYSDAAVFSFHPAKIATTAEGGIVTTASPALARKVRQLRTHGITKDPAELLGENLGGWYFEQQTLGFNYRLTDLQAALGSSQLKKIGRFVSARRRLVSRYRALLEGLPLSFTADSSSEESSHHLFVVRLMLDKIRIGKKELFHQLHESGIGVQVHYNPIHLHPYYRARGFGPGLLPITEAYYREALSLPLYAGLSENEQSRVAATLRSLLVGS